MCLPLCIATEGKGIASQTLLKETASTPSYPYPIPYPYRTPYSALPLSRTPPLPSILPLTVLSFLPLPNAFPNHPLYLTFPPYPSPNPYYFPYPLMYSPFYVLQYLRPYALSYALPIRLKVCNKIIFRHSISHRLPTIDLQLEFCFFTIHI